MPLYVGNERINNVSISFTSPDGGTNTNDATLTSGAQMLQGVTAYSKGTKYTGTIPSKASSDITVTANTVKVPAGYYSTANTKTVAETTVATPAISVSSDGLITASNVQTAGYVAAKTTTATTQLTTQSAKTITPSSSAQVAVDAGKYTTGDITVSAVPTETKTITANGTYSPSNGKYFSSIEVAVAGDVPTYQSKTVTPSTSVQTITADDGYDALSDVTVSAIKTETKSVTPTTSTQTVTPTSGSYLTKVDVGAISTETKNVTANGTYTPSSGKFFSSVTVAVPSDAVALQEKTVTATEIEQVISPDSGYGGFSTVTVNPISSTYVGSGVPTKGATTITPTTSSQTAIANGTYATGNITVAAVPTETKNIVSNGTFTPSSGKFFSSVTVDVPSDAVALQEKTITPTESTQVVDPDNGYGGFSSVTVNGIPSTYVGSGVATKGATAITPSASQQTAVSADTYVTGAITVAAVPSETKNITSNGTYTPNTGKWFSSVSVNVPDTVFNTQTKSVTPSESEQTVAPDAGYDGLSSVTVGAISSTYIGSGVTRKSAATYTPTESEQTIAAGQYLDGAQTISAIPSTYVGSGVPTQGAKTVTPSTSVQTAVSSGTYVTGDIKVAAMPTGALSTPTINTSTGVVTAGVSTSGYLATSATKTLQLTTKGATTITPSPSAQTAITAGTYATGNITVEAMASGALSTPSINTSTGVVTAGVSTAGYLDTSATKTLQLITKSATTIVPSTTDQTIAAGQYLTGTQTIKGDANLVAANIASGVSIFGITGTHEGGSGIDTSDATATAADIVDGATAYVNGAKLTGTLVVQNYYTGSTVPESSLGNDGDLYFKV